MGNCGWESIPAFDSLNHYKQFLRSMESAVASTAARAVAVDPKAGWGSAWKERWYRCEADGRVWRLVAPDPPFPGVFELV